MKKDNVKFCDTYIGLVVHWLEIADLDLNDMSQTCNSFFKGNQKMSNDFLKYLPYHDMVKFFNTSVKKKQTNKI